MKKVITFLSTLLLLLAIQQTVIAQANVLNPNDPDRIFTSSNQPAAPAYGSIAKWGHANRLGWNPYSHGYKSYYFNGMAFRVKFPKTYAHNVADGKKYPAFMFFHGLGEPGPIYDNELQLLHGGELFADSVDAGNYDGFLIFPQSSSGYLPPYFPVMSALLDSMVKHVKLDLDRVVLGGLSAGGQSEWDFMQTQETAKKTAGAGIASAAQINDVPYFPSHITIPILIANGGKDNSPAPYTATEVFTAYKNLGGDLTQFYYPNTGHGTWYPLWAEPEFFPFMRNSHKANPLIFFQRSEFCPNDVVSVKLGLQAGFAAYEWSKDGVTIGGATTNEITVTQFGTYRGRFKRTAAGAWSEWSPTPAVIKSKSNTVTPPIQISGMYSNLLPSPDGSTTVPLTVPGNFVAYEWRKVSDNSLVSDQKVFNAPVGQYKLQVTEQYGCSSSFGDPYTVLSAGGANAPDAVSALSAIALSNTSIQLYWNDNPTPVNNETAFEIYRSTTSGTGYSLIARGTADVLNYLDQPLIANTKYYYIVRSINGNGASAISSEANATTKSDIILPTAPSNLSVTGSTRTSISLAWDEATDDAGVYKYDIFVNGTKLYSTSNTFFTVNNLTGLQAYTFYVKARDFVGNLSPASNQVTGIAQLNGLTYKYYEFEEDLAALPDFNAMTPLATGTSANVTIAPRLRNDKFAFMWQGFIKIPSTGSYTFETNSDDGSRLYIGEYSYATAPLVNNDGAHGAQYASGTISLTAGIYPITITFFENGGGESMNIYWRSTAAGILTRTAIPNSAFTDNTALGGSAPTKPSFLNVTSTSYKSLTLSWTDNSNNETGFEIVRSTEQMGTFIPVGTTAANTTTFVDSLGLDASTKYWYKVRAINQYAPSAFVSIVEGKWSLNNDYNDASGNGRVLVPSGSPTFSTDVKEGSHSSSITGTQFLDMPFSSGGLFPSNVYTTRTVGIWIKPTAANIAAANKIIFDFGGSDDGLALRFNSGALQAGIASNNTRATAVVNSVTGNASWISNGWNHIAVVYNVNVLKLFINGVERASTNLSFSTLGTTTGVSAIGATNGSNAFNSATTTTNYAGLIDDVIVLTEPLNAANIIALMNSTYPAATTAVLPAAPAAPSNLAGTAQSTSAIAISFRDNSTVETEFEIYRSVTSTGNYRLLATLNPATGSGTTINYSDVDLFANTNYYYKVRSKGVGGYSAFTSDLLVKTLAAVNAVPQVASISSFSMLFGTQKNVSVTATDANNDPLTLSVTGLPAFATFTDNGNGTGSFLFNPTVAGNAGTYPITVTATDDKNATGTASFTATVTLTADPVTINPVGTITLTRGTLANVTLTTNSSTALTWSVVSGPGFATLTGAANGTATYSIAPSAIQAAGTYPVTINATNGTQTGSVSFNVQVTAPAPPPPAGEKVLVSIRYTSPAASSPWNNVTGLNTNNFLNQNGQATTTGLEFINNPVWNAWYDGPNTGNNSGVYPDAVLKDYFYFGIFGAPETITFRLKGLTVGQKYNVTLYAGSIWGNVADNGTTNYTINGVTKSLAVQGNTQNTVTFTDIVADASGYITVSMAKAAGTPVGYLSALTFEKAVDAPPSAIALPTGLATQALADGTVRLTWTDVANNEDNYLVYRASSAAGPYTLLNAAATNANATQYIDATTAQSTTYYYKVEATNATATSGLTAAVSATTISLSGEKIFINVRHTGTAAGTPWNNITGVNTNGLRNEGGSVTSAGIEFLTTAWNTWNEGTVTGNNSGIYPDVVLRDYYYFGIYGAPETVSFRLKGLTVGAKYNVTLHAGSRFANVPNNGTTVYTINGTAKSLAVQNNSANIVTFSSITADASGYITVAMTKAPGTPVGYLNALVLEKPVADANPPAKPTNLTAQLLPTGAVRLTWIDVAANEDRYLVSRASNVAGPYSVLNAGASNAGATEYTDNTTSSNNTYFYKIEAVNDNGSSGLTDAVSIITINKVPELAEFSNVFIKTGTNLVVNINATDDAGDILTITATNLPAFATFQNISNGVARITFAPGTNDLGVYNNITVKVQDNAGASVTRSFNATVTDSEFRSIYVNFGPQGSTEQPAPWNNYLAYPFANLTLSDLVDDANVVTPYSVRLLQQWDGNFTFGMITGNNSGVFPDNVIRGSIQTASTAARTIQLDGLNPARRYNVVFLASLNAGSDATVTFASGAQNVTIDAKYNSNKTVQLNNLTPNASGTIQVTATKSAAGSYINLNALVIQEFTAVASQLFRPTDLFVESDLSANRMILKWSDRSYNETGYQIYRSTSLNGTYTLVTTTAANVTTYTNTGLSGNTRYYYRVRAVNGGTTSGYSNTASNILAAKRVYVNMQVNYHEPSSQWNNTDYSPIEGATFSDLKDVTGVNTGIEMVITKPFNGEFYAGMTGNDGVFPNNVMQSNYWADAGQQCQVKLTNLDQSKRYRIGLFGSADWFDYFIATYTINGKTVYLNSFKNKTKVVYLENISPDQNGEIYIDISTAEGSPYSFTGAITIESFDDPTTPVGLRPTKNSAESDERKAATEEARSITVNPATGIKQVTATTTETAITVKDTRTVTEKLSDAVQVRAFPNPFAERVAVELTNDYSSSITLMLYDNASNLVYKTVQNVAGGASKKVINLNLSKIKHLPNGNYTLNVVMDGKVTKSVKLIKAH